MCRVEALKSTIKNYRQITQYFSKLGYKYEGTREIKEKQPELKGSKIPTTKRERIFYVLNRLLSNDAPVNVYDLAEEIFASESNLKLDFKVALKIREKFFNLTLKQRGDYFSIPGEEEDKHTCFQTCYIKKARKFWYYKSIIRSNFPTIDLDGLYTITQACAKDHHIYLNTFDLNNIVLHVVIAIQRIRDGYQTQPQLDDFYWKSSRFAKDLLKKVENSQTNVRFSKDDLESLGLVIDGSGRIMSSPARPIQRSGARHGQGRQKQRLPLQGFLPACHPAAP